ncbi:hypothetical protein SLEP1_g49640 [Rubroshorea leprosula]|uniref:Uncharacterized protein n=1 Tax=Rubroshorea leprosula TaxID=152421 RepID=A0AAV5LXG5_9ROSI|nr:hypothetical protein SLEP1_g49640 [Rubroshorea leprosula]
MRLVKRFRMLIVGKAFPQIIVPLHNQAITFCLAKMKVMKKMMGKGIERHVCVSLLNNLKTNDFLV